MSKRIISFLLTATMVMSLFAVSLSVSAASVTGGEVRYVGGGDVVFTVTGTTGTSLIGIQPAGNPPGGINANVDLTGTQQTQNFIAFATDADGYVLVDNGEWDFIVEPGGVEVPVRTHFTVEWDGDGGTVTGGGARTQNAALTHTVAVATATRAGFTFDGWSSSVAGITAPNTGNTTAITADVIFTAQWLPEGEAEYSVSVSGPSSIVEGTSGTFTATLLDDGTPVSPSIAQSAFEWSVAGHNNVAINASGVVTVQHDVPAGTSLTVTATITRDGNQYSGTATTVVAAAAQIVDTPGAGAAPGAAGAWVPRTDEDRVMPIDEVPPAPIEGEPTWGMGRTPAFLLFQDTPLDAWFHDFVTIVAHYNMFQGTAPRTFSPQMPMNRAMFAQVLANRAGAGAGGGAAAPFHDVVGHWGAPAIAWAYSQNIVEGIGQGYFLPNEPITREQMATMLYRYANARGVTLPTRATATFGDQGAVSGWAAAGVSAIQNAGIIVGFPDGNFRPQQTATRAEVATIFARYVAYTTNCPDCAALLR